MTMLKVLELIANDPNKFEKLKNSKKDLFISIAAKYCINIQPQIDLYENPYKLRSNKGDEAEIKLISIKENSTEEIYSDENRGEEEQEKINEDKITRSNNLTNNLINQKIISNDGFKNKENEKNDISENQPNTTKNIINKSYIRRLTVLESDVEDLTDSQNDDYLLNIYKKKMNHIPMKRLSENNYLFGTQKIEIKNDDGIIRGKQRFLFLKFIYFFVNFRFFIL